MAFGTEPAQRAVAITPSDNTVVNCRAIYVGGAGSVVITDMTGGLATFAGVPAGTFMPVSANKVMAATTATNLMGLY